MKCNFHQIYCYCCAIECECERGRERERERAGMQMAEENGNCINGVVCLIMQALCCAVSEPERRPEGNDDWAHSCWSIAKSIINTHSRTLAQQAKQIGGYYCHYNNVYYCYPFNTKWPPPGLTGAILTFKCRRHCSKLTVRGQTATRLALSQHHSGQSASGEQGEGQGAADCQRLKSQRERNSSSPGKCYAKHLHRV